jgi:hypothetical protein
MQSDVRVPCCHGGGAAGSAAGASVVLWCQRPPAAWRVCVGVFNQMRGGLPYCHAMPCHARCSHAASPGEYQCGVSTGDCAITYCASCGEPTSAQWHAAALTGHMTAAPVLQGCWLVTCKHAALPRHVSFSKQLAFTKYCVHASQRQSAAAQSFSCNE